MRLLQEGGILFLLGMCPRKYGPLVIIFPGIQLPEKRSHLHLGACFNTDVFNADNIDYLISRSFCVL